MGAFTKSVEFLKAFSPIAIFKLVVVLLFAQRPTDMFSSPDIFWPASAPKAKLKKPLEPLPAKYPTDIEE